MHQKSIIAKQSHSQDRTLSIWPQMNTNEHEYE
jgi:hypothetical protein